MLNYQLTQEELDLFNTSIDELQKVWDANVNRLNKMHDTTFGIRSSQIGALLMLAIKRSNIADVEVVAGK
ncbi:MAG: hypothetical protein GY754_45760 [bacterium]|nr:hypothetical protein [bacterium]